MAENPNVVLHCEKMEKIYPGTKALDEVSFDVLEGKVNVLIGENGAGKSTLMKLIAGIEQPSGGTMYMDGKEVYFKDTNDARNHGIGIIHQELSLFPNLNIYQNIFMCHEQKKGLFLDDKAHAKGAEVVLKRLEHEMNPNTLVGELRVGQQQMIEIARNLIQNDLKILIMDEPTSSLSAAEVKVLFKIMRELNEAGISIVYISHRLEEIMEIGDHVTILRDGKYVADADVKDIELPWIVKNMVGSEKSYHRISRDIDLDSQPEILRIENLCLPKKGGGWLLNNVSFNLREGEILGIYGLLGAGRTEVFECIMGMHPEHTGKMYLRGEEFSPKNIAEQIDRGFAIVPEDRQREGLVQSLDIGRNISLSVLKRLKKAFFVDEKTENEQVESTIKDIHIKVADKRLPILSLSGGNQQKVVIGKGLLTDPSILLLDEPSRGIDIGAKTEVFDIIHEYAQKGLSIIVISSELKEIMAIADRIVVLSNGIVTGVLDENDITEDNLVLASYAGHHTDGTMDEKGE
ncbi:sugar ABC transporter ATP-binding protein [Pseudobutyrivibrio sp.]|uniref:sugar ABC transporter ATP-binding protein n=1 Tax=Pseudobutyrivibrio sp. TaxID=2014367 RepID=UPI001DE7C066|nr:sugar ABC transporter ATP-binding protein [Pseudobutyrivibrio sp.]MBE5911262.1 sugar ABC transporter ATP-binding protein [Pseudobutyrivibrio sp.]